MLRATTMPEHTIPLRGRNSCALCLTDEEAVELHDKGFRFSIFRPGREQCHSACLYEVAINMQRGTITIRQSQDGVLTVGRPMEPRRSQQCGRSARRNDGAP
ncbi:hypothetical protein GCM10010862_26990 [Devosia nitrariae]|uniref:Uncharacterized protein n=1 Tax=Devosia nitrariae TaxID=2071872 RepID=A0ABQ5W686_9HYPH|nr:hypothetical protein GCM10010862_26990 [Devosia nitrariae]